MSVEEEPPGKTGLPDGDDIPEFEGIEPVPESEQEVPPESNDPAEDGFLDSFKEAERVIRADEVRKNLAYILTGAIILMAAANEILGICLVVSGLAAIGGLEAASSTAALVYAFRCMIK